MMRPTLGLCRQTRHTVTVMSHTLLVPLTPTGGIVKLGGFSPASHVTKLSHPTHRAVNHFLMIRVLVPNISSKKCQRGVLRNSWPRSSHPPHHTPAAAAHDCNGCIPSIPPAPTRASSICCSQCPPYHSSSSMRRTVRFSAQTSK